MKEWIMNNPIELAVIAIIIIGVCVLIYKDRKDVLYKAALMAVARAQLAWGSDVGKLKFAEVYAYLKTNYPVITFFISSALLTKIIEDALEELKRLIEAKAKKNEKNEEENDELVTTLLKQIASGSIPTTTSDSSPEA
jgi:hypothetical protein